MRSVMFKYSKQIWNLCTMFLILSASDFLKMVADGDFLNGIVSVGNTVVNTYENVKDEGTNIAEDGQEVAQDNIDSVKNILKNLTELPVDDKEVIFQYYNKDSPDGKGPFNINEFDTYKLEGWRDGGQLKVITHGWKESDRSDSVTCIKNAHLEKNNHNLITVNWSGPASDDAYVKAASKSKAVGKIISRLITLLVDSTLVTWDKVHGIGSGIGGHVMGVLGAETNAQIGRLTGLDPSNLIFNEISVPDVRVLDSSDAWFVDVIYTAGGELGSINLANWGGINFYPNGGGHPQPGCLVMEIKCSNVRASEYFAESIINPDAFVGRECDNWVTYNDGNCNDKPSAVMGDLTPSDATGVFYLATNDASPYGKGNAE